MEFGMFFAGRHTFDNFDLFLRRGCQKSVFEICYVISAFGSTGCFDKCTFAKDVLIENKH